MSVPWERLVRFVATDGRTLRGEPLLPHPDFDLGTTSEKDKLQAKVITGEDIYNTTGQTKVTDEVVTVKKLLGPLTPEEVPFLRCIGLNYTKHGTPRLLRKTVLATDMWAVRETGRKPPAFPFYFVKPSTTVIGHGETVRIPPIAQDEQADYEGELVCYDCALSECSFSRRHLVFDHW